jgi:prepilin-type processing-associated H-X9-DG protein
VAGRFFVAGSAIQARFGIAWQDANPMYVSFNTVFPPNAASCADGGINGDSVHLVIPPASRHTGGVNVTLCDGSVRFVGNNIDTGNLNARQTISGPSMYGAWGALGSRSGGEVASIPD